MTKNPLDINVPSIDISPFLVPPKDGETAKEEEHQLAVARQIDTACREHGFVHLTNELQDIDQVFAAARELFALPTEHKMNRLNRITAATNMGYSPVHSESLNRRHRPPEPKEAFNVRFPPAHTNQLDGCPESFVHAVNEILLPQLRPLIRAYLHACAVALSLPPTYLCDGVELLDLCTVRFLHAPPSQVGSVRVGEHTDFGAVTFLFYDTTSEGLQIKPVVGGTVEDDSLEEGWQDINAPSILVNTGALLARWTNDVWKATAHRVVVGDEAAASCSRYSIAVFVDPDASVVVDVHEKFLANGQTKKYEPISSLDFLLEKLRDAQGVK